MNPRGACAIAAALLVLSACGESGTKALPPPADVAIEPGSRAAAQKVLNKAEAHVDKSGTGTFLLRMNLARGISIGGAWDLRAPATDYTLTMSAIDDREDVVVRSRIIDNAAYTQVSTMDDAMCWMKLDSADRLSMGMDADISPVHPAVLMLLEPRAVGFVKDSRVAGRQDIRAEMAFDEAVPAAFPKAFNKMSKPVPEGATVPVTVGIDSGRYASIRYAVADIIRVAKANDLDFFAAAGDEADEVADGIADAKIKISFRSFGDKVDIAAPDPDLIVDMDAAELQASGGNAETCAAADQ